MRNLIDKWIREIICIGPQEYTSNIIVQIKARSIKNQNVQCSNCGEFGHFQKNCKARRFKAKIQNKQINKEKQAHKRDQSGSGCYEPQKLPWYCSYCGKGKHWSKYCQSKREMHEVTACHQGTNWGACQLKGLQQTLWANFL